MRKYNKLVILGTGNVAHALGKSLRESGRTVLQVWGRKEDAAKKLGIFLQVPYTTQLEEMNDHADAYIICVKDDAIAEVAAQFPFINKPLIHTAGTVGLDVLSSNTRFPAVWWVMQSIQKNTSLVGAPSIIDYEDKEMVEPMQDLAGILRGDVVRLRLEQRRQLHLTAVMLANFSQYLGGKVMEYAKKNELPAYLLYPLMRNVLHQVMEGNALGHLTGPARRNDEKVLRQQMQLLEQENDLHEIYSLFSRQIIDLYKDPKKAI